ncbi:hypothetical protein GCM10022237_03470 [Nocardioides ginsengisoli]|uniref:Uncharacterized protein n=1 Tax=Nocardioides ginsengisoli TaxID=363868 RepID=A0ABW3VWW6_9ACTN
MAESAWAAGFSRVILAGLVTGLLVVSGCSSDPTGRPTKPAKADSAATRGGAVDPQVLDDVAATLFPAPGPSVRRMMRVSTFIGDFIVIACGATERPSIDRTVERAEQDVFPDLELIRTKGLVEKDPRVDREGNPLPLPGLRQGCDARSKGNLFERVPSRIDAMHLREPWDDVVATVEQDPSVVALKAPFAQCLRKGTKGTGVVVSNEDPAPTFLTQTDLAYARHKISTRDRERRIPRLYVKCGRRYFARTQALLEARRPAMIERHRELLERFARELVAIGYVP